MSFWLLMSTGSPQSPPREIPTKPADVNNNCQLALNKHSNVTPAALSLLTFLFPPPLHVVAVPDLSVCLVKSEHHMFSSGSKPCHKWINLFLPYLNDVMCGSVRPCSSQLQARSMLTCFVAFNCYGLNRWADFIALLLLFIITEMSKFTGAANIPMDY